MQNKNTDFYAGLYSGLISNIICNPFDVIRVNKQLSNKIEYNYKFLSRGLISGFFTIPTFWSIYFQTYNYLKINNDKILGNNLSFLNGYIASNISSTITSPLWFIRQKNQLSDKFNIIEFYKKNGIISFYSGLNNTYIINASFMIQMPVYEKLKLNIVMKDLIKDDTLRIFVITSIAKTVSACVFYPMDTIRSHRRAYHETSLINIIRNLNKNPLNYYRGLKFYLLRSIPYHSITFCSYEYLKNKLN